MSQKGGALIVLGMADNGSEDSTSMVHEKIDVKSRKMCMKKCKKHGNKCTIKCLKKMKNKKNKRGGFDFSSLYPFSKNNEESVQYNEQPIQNNAENKPTFFGRFANMFKPNECDQQYADAIKAFNEDNKYKNEYDQEFIALKNKKLIDLSNARMRCKNTQQNAGGKKSKKPRKSKKNKSRRKH